MWYSVATCGATFSVLSVYFQCTFSVLLVYFQCTFSVLSVYFAGSVYLQTAETELQTVPLSVAMLDL